MLRTHIDSSVDELKQAGFLGGLLVHVILGANIA